jgi:chromate transporter
LHTAPTQSPHVSVQASFWRLFLIWAGIGLQSFGGGASTLLLMQREFIAKRHWLTMEEFTHFLSLSMFTPGINLVAMNILIGRKLGGVAGAFSSLVGMLLPSALITCLITVIFTKIESIAAIQAIVKGIVPATGGIMFIVGLNLARPQLRLARKGGPVHIVICLAFILTGIVAIIIFDVPIVILLPCAGLLGLIVFTYVLKSQEEQLSK